MAEAFIEGFNHLNEGVVIHRDAGDKKLEEEITLYPLFCSINALPTDYIDKAYEAVYNSGRLTDNAMKDFNTIRKRYTNNNISALILAKIFKLYACDYYNDNIKCLIQLPKITTENIDLNDTFNYNDLCRKAQQHVYNYENEVIRDISRFLRYISNNGGYYLEKQYDNKCKKYVIKTVETSTMDKNLRKVKIWKKKTAYNIMERYGNLIMYDSTCFVNNGNDRLYPLFHGFKSKILFHDYKTLDEDVEIDHECMLQRFLHFLCDDIANLNKEVYTYILNWIAFIVQNTGKRNGTVIVLTGCQGSGKTTFVNFLHELFSGYCATNLTSLKQVIGPGNSIIENKIFVDLNEVRSYSIMDNPSFDTFKTYITEDVIQIEEK